MAGAGAGAGSGAYTVHPFVANGHGEQCIRVSASGLESITVPYELPPGVHFVTVQEAGKYALLSGTSAVREALYRGFNSNKMVRKPAFDKEGNEEEWCTSDYVRFKHEIAQAFNAVGAATQEDVDTYGDLYDFLFSEHRPRDTRSSRLSFDELVRKGKEKEYEFYFEDLCDLYDRRIHIRYPGETISDNTFTPISYVLDDATQKFLYLDGAPGVIDGEVFAKLLEEDKTNRMLMQEHTIKNLNANPSLFSQLYSASVYPTKEEVAAYLKDPRTKSLILSIPDKQEATEAEKTLSVLDTKYKIKLSDLIPMIVEEFSVTAENPIVLYFPLCRAFPPLPQKRHKKEMVKEENKLAKMATVARSTSFTTEKTGQPQEHAVYRARQQRGRAVYRVRQPERDASRSRDRTVQPGQDAGPGSGPAGGRRKTFRKKKKLRKQTRRRRQ